MCAETYNRFGSLLGTLAISLGVLGGAFVWLRLLMGCPLGYLWLSWDTFGCRGPSSKVDQELDAQHRPFVIQLQV